MKSFNAFLRFFTPSFRPEKPKTVPLPPPRVSIYRLFAFLSDSSPPQTVTRKEQFSSNSLLWVIDGRSGWRYSQAQIPDLVANTIPRFRQAAQSSGSVSPSAAQKSLKISSFPQSFPVSVHADVSGPITASNLLALVAARSTNSGSTTAKGRCLMLARPWEAIRNL